MFNLKKYASKTEYSGSTEKRLRDSNNEFNLASDDKSGNINYELQKTTHKDNDSTVPFEQRLGEARANKSNNTILEKSLDNNDKLFLERRSDKVAKLPVIPTAALEAAAQAKNLEAFQKIEKEADKETLFWDKYIGSQMDSDMRTNIMKNNPKSSQLENNPDRFNGLNLPLPGNTHEDNAKSFGKKDEVTQMVYASLKDADAMLFHIYATAATQNRVVNELEQNQVNDINSYKTRLLAFANGDFKQRFILANNDKCLVCERYFENTENGLKYKEKKLESFANVGEAFKAYPDINKIGQGSSGYGYDHGNDQMGAGESHDQMGSDPSEQDAELAAYDYVDYFKSLNNYEKFNTVYDENRIRNSFDQWIKSDPNLQPLYQNIYQIVLDTLKNQGILKGNEAPEQLQHKKVDFDHEANYQPRQLNTL